MATSVENDLIKCVSTEIYLDGGSTIVTALRDFYDDDKTIARLLKHCQSRKLLSFLESKPEFFHVSDRNNPPHVVTLKELGTQYAEKAFQGRKDSGNFGCLIKAAAVALEERVAYLLRQRISKVVRRSQRLSDVDVGSSVGPVPVTWVARKCSNDLHRYLRLLPSRPNGVLPKSDEWLDMSIAPFVTFIQERSSSLFVMTMESKDGEDPLPLVDLCQEEKDKVIKSFSVAESGSLNSVDLEAVSARVLEILKNLAPVGGVQLGRLLSDVKLRSLLGGIDLLILIQANPSLFEEVTMFRDANESHGQWYIMLKWKERVRYEGGKIIDENRSIGFGDLATDEVGLFSLTNPTIAMAMAKIIRNILSNNFSQHSRSGLGGQAIEAATLAIDLTAGIGGNTIALAKVFPEVIAFEINKNRSILLEENCKKKLGNLSSRVTLYCRDSMRALSEISNKFRGTGGDQRPICVMLDPPWGGVNYRRKCCEDELKLGEDMPLSMVVSLVAQHLAPVVLGMKLPLQFKVNPFMYKLQSMPYFCMQDTSEVRIATIKKMGKQLFVVLELRSTS